MGKAYVNRSCLVCSHGGKTDERKEDYKEITVCPKCNGAYVDLYHIGKYKKSDSKMKLELANRSILNCLELAAEKKEFIYTRSHQRVLGKTKALIQFAKENDYTVLVHHASVARNHQKIYGYQNVISIGSKSLDGIGPVVFDEGCSPAQIKELIRFGHKVITGFISEGPIDRE